MNEIGDEYGVLRTTYVAGPQSRSSEARNCRRSISLTVDKMPGVDRDIWNGGIPRSVMETEPPKTRGKDDGTDFGSWLSSGKPTAPFGNFCSFHFPRFQSARLCPRKCRSLSRTRRGRMRSLEDGLIGSSPVPRKVSSVHVVNTWRWHDCVIIMLMGMGIVREAAVETALEVDGRLPCFTQTLNKKKIN